MTASEKAKSHGLKSLTQIMDITGVSLQTLTNWFNHKPDLFEVVVLGCVVRQNNEAQTGAQTPKL